MIKKRLILSHTKGTPGDLAKYVHSENSSHDWVFFGQDYYDYLKLKEGLPINFKERKIHHSLEKAAAELRGPFLDLISDLGKKHDSIAWWASRVSERNTLVSFLFLYCCYLKIFKQELDNISNDFYVLGEDWDLLESFACHANQKGVEVIWISRQSQWMRRIFVYAKALKRIIKWFLQGFLSKLAGTDFRPSQGTAESILIHTYINDACFGDDGVFRDPYFPGVCSWFENKGYIVVTLPVLYNMKYSIFSAWKWLRNNNKKFLNPYSYFCLSDYIFALRKSWTQRRMPQGRIELLGQNVSVLFAAERDRFLFSSLEPILYARLPLRLKLAGFSFKEVIYCYENMVIEKLMVLGFRQYSPETRTVGFQHSAPAPLMLCLFVPPQEASFAPLPDKIICTGEFFCKIFADEGIPSQNLKAGPALRFDYEAFKHEAGTEGLYDILVVFPLMESETCELLVKVIDALGDLKDIRVVLKLHPMMSSDTFIRCKGSRELPKHFEFIEGDFFDNLFKAKIMVAMASSVIMGAFVAGIPLIIVGRDAAINFNPLEFMPEHNHVFYSSKEIQGEALRVLSLSKDRWPHKTLLMEKVGNIFNPVTEETMKMFLLN